MVLSKKQIEAASAVTAQQELGEKIRLEGKVVSPLRGFFNRMNTAFRKQYQQDGTILDASEFEPELLSIVQNQYRLVANSFKNSFRSSVEKFISIRLEYKQGDADVDKALREFIIANSIVQAAFITRTSNKIFNEAVQKALFEFSSEGNFSPTLEEVGQRAYSIAKIQNLGRVNNIATTITQDAAEGTKYTEIQTLIASGTTVNGTDLSSAMSQEKEWNSVLDGKTRPAHVVADGQRRPLDEPYDVDGEQLMYPGDISLGATPRNTNHCRCGSQYVLSEFVLSAEQVDVRSN